MYCICEWENDLKVKAVNCQSSRNCQVYVKEFLDKHFPVAVDDWSRIVFMSTASSILHIPEEMTYDMPQISQTREFMEQYRRNYK